MKKRSKLNSILTLLIILLLVFIWGNSLLSVEKSDALSRWVLEHILRADKNSNYFDTGDHLLRKATHVTEFAILALLFTLRMRQKRRFWLFGGFAAIAAAADETIQIFSHRGSQVKDVGIDCIGVVLGTLIVYIIISRKKRKERS